MTSQLHQTIYDGLMKGDDGDSGPFIALTQLVEQYEALERENDRFRSENRNFKATVDALSEKVGRLS